MSSHLRLMVFMDNGLLQKLLYLIGLFTPSWRRTDPPIGWKCVSALLKWGLWGSDFQQGLNNGLFH